MTETMVIFRSLLYELRWVDILRLMSHPGLRSVSVSAKWMSDE